MRRSSLVALPLVAACAGAPGGSGAPPDRAQLTASMVAQFSRSADAWNRDDLEAFLSDYADDSLTSFVSQGHLHRGFDFIRQNYTPRFAPGAAHDSLRFEELDARPLSPSLALVTARYVLFKGDSVTSSGPFTLVMEHRPQGWKILHDHTSSDPR
jgi:beta-aspartyl-peptidase (threonine type)